MKVAKVTKPVLVFLMWTDRGLGGPGVPAVDHPFTFT